MLQGKTEGVSSPGEPHCRTPGAVYPADVAAWIKRGTVLTVEVLILRQPINFSFSSWPQIIILIPSSNQEMCPKIAHTSLLTLLTKPWTSFKVKFLTALWLFWIFIVNAVCTNIYFSIVHFWRQKFLINPDVSKEFKVWVSVDKPFATALGFPNPPSSSL